MSRNLKLVKHQITRAETKSRSVTEMSPYQVKQLLDELEADYHDLQVLYSELLDTVEDSKGPLKDFDEYCNKYSSTKAVLKEYLDKCLEHSLNDTIREAQNDHSLAGVLEKQNEILDRLGRVSATASESNDKTLKSLFEKQNEILEQLSKAGAQKRDEIKLPFLKIPQFSGEYVEWVKFRDLFEGIVVKNTKISNVEKLHYLSSLLVGQAASLIKHFPLAEANFVLAWNCLLERYNKPYFLVHSLIQKFMNSDRVNSRLSNLRSVTSLFQETINVLDNLGDYGKSRDPWLIYLIAEKLDKETREGLADEIAEEDEPSIKQCFHFLEERCNTKELSDNMSDPISIKKPVKSFHATTVAKCAFCNRDHLIYKCEKFASLTSKEKEKAVANRCLCFNCLKPGHGVKDCRSERKCETCSRRHNTLLHRGTASKPSDNKEANTAEQTSGEDDAQTTSDALIQVHFNRKQESSPVILPTVVLNILGSDGQNYKCRALLDTGSQANFISEECASRLNLKKSKLKVPIQGISSTEKVYSNGTADVLLSSFYDSTKQYNATVYVLSHLTTKLPNQIISLDSIPTLQERFNLADSKFYLPAKIDIILGASIFFEILGQQKFFHKKDFVWIQETSLGYIVSGGNTSESCESLKVNLAQTNLESENLDKILERFWKIEDVSVERPLLTDGEIHCDKIFKETTVRLGDGRYSVDLPFNDNVLNLGESYHLAKRRLESLEKRLALDPVLKKEYACFMTDYLKLGHLEKIPFNEINLVTNKRYYIPHHPIWQNSHNKKKLRVVFDASMKTTSGISLNDTLYVGKNLQKDGTKLITKSRIFKYYVEADIEKMYRQIEINNSCRDYQRILLKFGENIEHYRLKTVTYGESCSPYIALSILNRLAIDEKENYPIGAQILEQDNYMDDFHIGSNDRTEILEMIAQLIKILNSAGMSLKKWASNDFTLLNNFHANDIADPDLLLDKNDTTIKALGIRWCPREDYYTFRYIPTNIGNYSKRQLLSDVAKIFDPLGFISPVIIVLKILFQETWLKKLSWDEALPKDMESRWMSIKEQLSVLEKLKIPRWIGTTENFEIHGFSDASEKAYAAMLYSRTIDKTGKPTIRLIVSKTKLAPITTISVARLELCAAHLLAKLVKSFVDVFAYLKPSVYLWCDSKIVISWLSAHPCKWATFVSNRCGQIHSLCPNLSWNYVRSQDNPADLASRGLSPENLLICPFWWNGPDWLPNFDRSSVISETYETSDELKRQIALPIQILKTFFTDVVKRFSSFERLRRCFAYVLRYLNNLKPTREKLSGTLTTEELSKSTRIIIRELQREEYFETISRLENKKPLDRENKLVTLNPFLDEENIMRVGGRLKNAPISSSLKHPIIMFKGHFLVLLIRYVHESYYHAGSKFVITALRHQFFIYGLNNFVKHYVRKCITCMRYNAKPYDPLMSQLPEYRVTPSKPFLSSGVDFAGPILMKPCKGRGRSNVKGYIAVFVCMVTKALHLELVMGLSTDAFIMALRRFLARRGECKTLWSDNGRNFVGSSREIIEWKKHVISNVEDQDVQNYLTSNLVTWKFIPIYSPHFGGIWESGVKTIKYHLRKTFGDNILTIEELMTALAQIEAIANSRPLEYIETDDGQDEILTPSHFLTGYPSIVLPILDIKTNFETQQANRSNKARQSLIKTFWLKWKNEHLQSLLKFSKWSRQGKSPEIGDVVLIKRRSDPPTYWSKGKIINVFPGEDNIVRKAEVQSIRGKHVEASRNLIPLILNRDDSTRGGC